MYGTLHEVKVSEIPKRYQLHALRSTHHAQRTPSHGDLAIDYLRFTIDYLISSLCPPVAEQRTPCNGDYFGIWLTANGLVRIIVNELVYRM